MSDHAQDLNCCVIGAGPAGSTAGFELARNGARVTIFESSHDVGGLAKSIELWGHRVDLGPHRFFTKNDRVNRLWLNAAGPGCTTVIRKTRILYENQFFDYPLTPFDVLSKLGPFEAAIALVSYLRQYVRPQADTHTLESWLIRRFGKHLYNKFFRLYSEKLWGRSCGEIDEAFAVQRIRRFSLTEALFGMLVPRSGSHRTLLTHFQYPNRGSGSVYSALLDAAQRQGATIRLGQKIVRIHRENNSVWAVETDDGNLHPCSQLISSMPLNALISALEPVPEDVKKAAEKLKFRATVLVYLKIDAKKLFEDNWIYVHSPELRFGRITNFCNWSPDLCGKCSESVLCIEYWCEENDALWTSPDRTIVDRCKDEIARLFPEISAKFVDAAVYRVPKAYPIYEKGYLRHVGSIRKYLETITNLQVIGRSGSFKYNNQDHSILMGLLAADNIVSGRRVDLWGVNASDEGYHEED